MSAHSCGDCGLWGRNFYQPASQPNTTCAADVVMDLPASFIPNRQTMAATDGEGCICWRPLDFAAPSPPSDTSCAEKPGVGE